MYVINNLVLYFVPPPKGSLMINQSILETYTSRCYMQICVLLVECMLIVMFHGSAQQTAAGSSQAYDPGQGCY